MSRKFTFLVVFLISMPLATMWLKGDWTWRSSSLVQQSGSAEPGSRGAPMRPQGSSDCANSVQGGSKLGAWKDVQNSNIPIFQQCMAKTVGSAEWATILQKYDGLPKLAIVVSSEKDKIDTATAHNIEAYAARHGYIFHVAAYNLDDWSTTKDGGHLHHFHSTRWLHLQQRYLGKYQWILHIDSDVLALNMSRSLDRFLELDEDIVLHMREFNEVAAGTVLLRSSPFSHCFLDYWISMGAHELHTEGWANTDNGDLVQVVIEFMRGNASQDCLPLRRNSNVLKSREFLRCFMKYYDDVATLHTHVPIRVFFPWGGGFWRTFNGPTPKNYEDKELEKLQKLVFHTCTYPSDIMGHNNKKFVDMWPAETRLSVSLNLTIVSSPLGCTTLTLAEELEVAKACCFTDYPNCLVQHENGTTTNICKQQAHCPGGHQWHPNCYEYISGQPVG